MWGCACTRVLSQVRLCNPNLPGFSCPWNSPGKNSGVDCHFLLQRIFLPKDWYFWTVLLEKTLGSPMDYKIKPVNPKGNQSWIFTGTTEVEAPILWPPDTKNWLIRERLRTRGDGDDRGWDGWMASPTRWTWVWMNSGSWWWTGRPGVLQFMGSQQVGHDWATEQNWTDCENTLKINFHSYMKCVACYL